MYRASVLYGNYQGAICLKRELLSFLRGSCDYIEEESVVSSETSVVWDCQKVWKPYYSWV